VTARIFQLACSAGGVPKLAVREAIAGELGLEGDRQQHAKIHGGPDRALCLFALELIELLQAEGHPIYPGSTGENVTISGLDWKLLAAGTRLALGPEVIAELTWEADPCKQIAESFVRRKFTRLGTPGEMRWYARVVRGGTLRVAQPVVIAS
jgi:MOSC domain-containing protein YiiM